MDKKVLQIVKDLYFWLPVTAVILFGVISLSTVFTVINFTYITVMIFESILFLVAVVTAAWRFRVKGGLTTCFILGVVLLPLVVNMVRIEV